jgi:predicted MPP superfamily phosphohydrolase
VFGPRVTFLAVVTGIAALVHAYFWLRLVRAPAWAPRWRRRLTVALVVLTLAVPAGFAAWQIVGPRAALPVTWIGSTWAGVLFLLFFLLLLADVLLLVAWVLRRSVKGPLAPDLDRRRLLARSVAGAAGLSALGLAGVGVASAASPPGVERIRVPIRRLPPAFEGFRIVQLSDMHVGPILRRPFVEDVVARTNALKPDLVAVTGDLVDGSVEQLSDAVAPLASLVAPHGTLFTTGNHEYYMGVDPWLDHLRSLGLRVLRNERMEIRRGDAAIDVAGIDDWGARRFGGGHGPDLDRALAGRDPDRPVVLLAHQPRQVRDARRLGVDLQLSGHTHGGQIAPFGIFVSLVQPAVKGLHWFEPTWLYVNRGTGTWGPPMRLGNPAEITVVELTRA